ncbi:MAG: ATP-grasp domain-containing protein [Caldisericia bacterium]|jgi:D-alanine-D-alanine ligase|nr:ATP-grasp domain-containing protein [Caldisericia bacterium]
MKIKIIGVVHDKILDKNKQKMVDSVFYALNKKYDAIKIPFDENFFENIKNVDFVFNLATSGGKEGRQIHVPAILDILGVPYTGSSAFVHTICLDKFITKLILSFYGISTPKFTLIKEYEINSFEKNFNLSFPVIVKPVREGSAFGLTKDSIVYDIEGIKREANKIHKEFSEPAIVEEFIEGREITCGIIGNGDEIEVLPFLEIDFYSLPDGIERFFSYRVKNEIEEVKYYCPARLLKDEEESLKEGVVKAYKVLNLRDYTRMDIRIKNGKYYILEVNSLPLLVPGYSDILKMAEKAGFTYDDFILKIIEIAIKRYM